MLINVLHAQNSDFSSTDVLFRNTEMHDEIPPSLKRASIMQC